MLNQDLSSLLPVKAQSFSDKTINAIDGRSLHAFPEVVTPFNIWMPRAIENFGFNEHQDFEVLNNSVINPQGGRPTDECMTSIDLPAKRKGDHMELDLQG